MSIPRDSPSTDQAEQVFVQRPWPQRGAHASPLVGRTVRIVDRDKERSITLGSALQAEGLVVLDAGDQRIPDLLVCADPLGSPLLPGGKQPVIVVTEAARHGFDSEQIWTCLPSPVDPLVLLAAFGRALEHQSLSTENAELRARLAARTGLGPLSSRDPRMGEILQTAQAVADTRATVLLLGESGTGKSLLARALHEASSRAEEPFVVVNCGALPGNLLESELFGHVKGAFTGAVQDKQGRFEQAAGGTLFLDEINSASPDLQVKLLRVLQERTFERVGEGLSRSSDARVIAATNRSLPKEIEAGTFREDLYWRLNVVSLTLPPLRERPADLAMLVDRFLLEFSAEYERQSVVLAPEALGAVAAYEWPGNIRQLRNALERAVLLTRGPEIGLGSLPNEVREAFGGQAAPTLPAGLQAGLSLLQDLTEMPTLKEALAGPERAILLRALELAKGSRKDAAESLGINRSTLFNKMTKYGLMDLSFPPSH